MTQKTLLELVTAPEEADYVTHFQSLATVNLEIRERGATCTRLLRKSILEMDIGNYQAALDAARDAIDLKPDLAEARYQEGMCLILLSFSRVGAVAGAPGMIHPLARARTLLQQAADAFEATIAANPADDEAEQDLEALQLFLHQHPEDDELEAALVTMAELV